MEETTKREEKPRLRRGMKRVADGSEATDVVPVVVNPVQVEVTLRVIAVEIRYVAVTIDDSNGALCDTPSKPRILVCRSTNLKLNRLRDLNIA